MIVHAGPDRARAWAVRWRGVLIEGPSGAGKSDSGAALPATTGFDSWPTTACCFSARASLCSGARRRPLEGLIEARGVGVLRESLGLPFCR